MDMMTHMLKEIGLVALLGTLIAIGGIKDSKAAIEDELNGKVLPPVTLHGPHPVVMIPETYIYRIPDIDVSIFFYEGYWYRPCDSNWFWAESNNGPWAYIKPSEVPMALIKLPPEYRREPCG
jgi:hypothetical protein